MSRNWSQVGCAFCGAMIHFDLTEGVQAPKRDTMIARVRCTRCDSTTDVWLQTKRKTKGKRFREYEVKKKAELAARVALAEAENDKLALVLLAEPGCTCGSEESKVSAAYYPRDHRPDGLDRGGTGRDGVPLPPRHRHHCPVRKT